jgi:hypothetical protein
MKRRPRAFIGGLTALRQAFDDVRFGPQKTLNLRDTLPTAAAAQARTDSWLRQKQVDQAGEVLIVTGRGNQSEGGIPVVREAVQRLLLVLRRRGVVSSHREHTPGSFIVMLAPVQSLWESPRRKRGRGVVEPVAPPPSLDDLDADTRARLRDLAIRSLEGLGIKDTDAFVRDEMLRQFSAIAASIGDRPDREARLAAAVRAALDQHE